MKYIKSFLFFCVIVLVGCNQQPTFTISGTISDGQDQKIYLEHTSLVGTTIIDSCVIENNGKFLLESAAPKYPDFYRIRIGQQSLPLIIDSIEQIQINSALAELSYTQDISGSESCLQIAKLRSIARKASRDELREASKQMIVANPASLVAYYAVFLKQNGLAVWDITQASDRRLFQAVATSFDLHWPDYDRTIALRNQVLGQLQLERNDRNNQVMQQIIEASENAFLDIALPDHTGKEQKLSSFRGNVIILDFSSTAMQQYSAYNFELRDLYNKYNKQGLIIYSVGVERNQTTWKEAVENLPWTTVMADSNTAQTVLSQYNVQSLPTLFLLDRKGNVQGRYIDFKSLETDIKKYL
ncbi:MAG: AhpC/TSA family protein [Paludibacteraceae bacterium]|nr:AhpC/TSA family protein [Paludibacteraceae bacterium]